METDRVVITNFARGLFSVTLDSQPTRFSIHNGALGMSGRNTPNTYGIYNAETQKVTWLGRLSTCKAAVRHALLKPKGVVR